MGGEFHTTVMSTNFDNDKGLEEKQWWNFNRQIFQLDILLTQTRSNKTDRWKWTLENLHVSAFLLCKSKSNNWKIIVTEKILFPSILFYWSHCFSESHEFTPKAIHIFLVLVFLLHSFLWLLPTISTASWWTTALPLSITNFMMSSNFPTYSVETGREHGRVSMSHVTYCPYWLS